MTDAIAAEWLKLRSARSTWYTLAVLVAVIVAGEAVTIYAAGVWDHLSAARQAHFSVTPADQLTGYFAELLLGILGVLAITTEYGTGMIRVTLTAVPRRSRLLAAKAVVAAVTALAVAAVSLTVTFALSWLIVGGRPMRYYTGPASHEVPMLLALTATTVIAALTGLGLGTVIRSTAGAITTLAGLWYVLPIVANLLPGPWASRLSSVLLPSLPQELAGARPLSLTGHPPLLDPPGAAVALAGYAVLTLVAAAFALRRRDA